MAITKKDRLIDRIKDNYVIFKLSLRGVSRETLFVSAGRIAAYTEAFKYMTEVYKWDEEGELDFFLLFRDPLTVIADEWEDYRDEMTADMDGVIYDVSDDLLSEYPLYSATTEYNDFGILAPEI